MIDLIPKKSRSNSLFMKHFTFILIPYEMTGVDLNSINIEQVKNIVMKHDFEVLKSKYLN